MPFCAILYMNMIKHGRETLVKISDAGKYVVKEPLPGRSIVQKREWLARQKNAADTIQKLLEIGNGAYGVPRVKLIDEAHFRVIEERVDGVPLSPLLFHGMDSATRNRVIDALAAFYADMHTINMIPNPIEYKMNYELDIGPLTSFVDMGMREIFPAGDIKFMEKTIDRVSDKSYETRLVWSHGDLFEDNVLYDFKTKKINIIDFTEVGTAFLHYDMMTAYPYDLGIVDELRRRYIARRGSNNLPADFADDARWARIKKFHDAAVALQNMNSDTCDLVFADNAARKKLVTHIKQQIQKLKQYER